MARIYTKKGDGGDTGLLGGSRVSKDSLNVSCYGTLDEANATIGIAYSITEDKRLQEILRMIQKKIFILGAELASDKKGAEFLTDKVQQRDVDELERLIDFYEEQLGPLNEFVIPGGSQASATIHLARTIIRRSERLVVELNKTREVRKELIKYINRLSDLLFTLARIEEKNSLISNVKEKVLERLGHKTNDNRLTLDIAKKMSDAVESKAMSMGVPVVFSVVDSGGNPLLLHRMEGALLASLDIAANKAYTSVALKIPTHEVANLVKPESELYGLQWTNDNKIVVFGGGYPLKRNNEIIGGIGVSGGTVEEDKTIANYALRVFEYERRS